MASSDPSVRYHVTLVHGTFARETEWVKEGSSLRNALSELGGVAFDRFQWTGANSHWARYVAGKALAGHLDKVAEDYPNAQRVVIGHSHGGNVALYAARYLRNPDAMQKLVCLATPFLSCQPLRATFSRIANLMAASLLLGALAYVVGSAFLSGLFGWHLAGGEASSSELASAFGFVNYPAGALMVLIISMCVYWLMLGYGRWVVADRLRYLQWAALPRTHVLSAIYHTDEAENLLVYANAVSTRTSRLLWGLLSWWSVILLACIAVQAIVIAATVLLPPFAALVDSFKPVQGLFSGDLKVNLTLLEVLLIANIGFFIFVAPIAFFLPLLRGNPWAFGWERPSWTMVLDVLPKDRPEILKASSKEHFEIPIGDFGKGRWMAHTAIYDDERIQKKVLEWISSQPVSEGVASDTSAKRVPYFRSDDPSALPWRDGSALALLGLPLLLLLDIGVFTPSAVGDVWLWDLEWLQYCLAAILGAWGGLFGAIAVGIAALLKVFRYAGEFDFFGLLPLRIVKHGSVGEAFMLIGIAMLAAQSHRFRLALRTNTWPAIPVMVFLAIAALIVLRAPDDYWFQVSSALYHWLLLLAFLAGLSQLRLLPLFVAVLIATGVSVGAAITGLAPMGRITGGGIPSWLVVALPFATIMVAFNLLLVGALGRGVRQRIRPSGKCHWFAAAVTSPAGLMVSAAIFLAMFLVHSSVVIGSQSGGEFKGTLAVTGGHFLLPGFIGLAAGLLYGMRSVWWCLAAYIIAGLIMPVALALDVVAPSGVNLSAVLFGVMKIEYSLGHLNIYDAMQLPAFALLGAVAALRLPELKVMTRDEAEAADVAALMDDDIVPAPRQRLASLQLSIGSWLMLAAVVIVVVSIGLDAAKPS